MIKFIPDDLTEFANKLTTLRKVNADCNSVLIASLLYSLCFFTSFSHPRQEKSFVVARLYIQYNWIP